MDRERQILFFECVTSDCRSFRRSPLSLTAMLSSIYFAFVILFSLSLLTDERERERNTKANSENKRRKREKQKFSLSDIDFFSPFCLSTID